MYPLLKVLHLNSFLKNPNCDVLGKFLYILIFGSLIFELEWRLGIILLRFCSMSDLFL